MFFFTKNRIRSTLVGAPFTVTVIIGANLAMATFDLYLLCIICVVALFVLETPCGQCYQNLGGDQL